MVKVSNENEVFAYHVARVFGGIFFVLYLVVVWAFPEYFSWSANKSLVITGHIYATIYLLVAVAMALKGGIWFIEFSFKDDYYEFRYYLLTTPFSQRRMVRISAEELYAFRVKASFFGWKKKLILYQEIKGEVRQYPPIPIGSLMSEKQVIVIDELKKYAVDLT